MNFYQNIAGYYHHIFPLNKNQVDFVKTACPDASGSSVLEVGCATGSLVIALSEIFDKVTGIDLDEAMLQKARHAVGNGINNVHLLPLNMLAIKNTFGTNAFDAIVCFGNTLVHLADEQQIFDFFIQARKALRPRGNCYFKSSITTALSTGKLTDCPPLKTILSGLSEITPIAWRITVLILPRA